MALDEKAFQKAADAMLDRLAESLGELDADHVGDVLTISFDDGSRCVVNRHTPARQIWMAALGRAWHFDYDPASDRWTAKGTGDELVRTLAAIVKAKSGQDLSL